MDANSQDADTVLSDDAVRAVLEAAAGKLSPLPWRWGRGPAEVLCEDGFLDADGSAVMVNCGRGAGEPADEDIAYFIAACNAAPALAREVLALRSNRDALAGRLRAVQEAMEREAAALVAPPEKGAPDVRH